MDCFLSFNILDHICTTCFVFAKKMENLFKVFLQIIKGIGIRFREAFSRFEIFSPCFKCFSFDLNKTPLDEILLLMFKRVLPIERRSNIFRYQFEKILTNWKTYQF
jgi:hypothetical protein